MDESCEICGSVKNREVLRRCSQCKIVHQHIYCMRGNLVGVPVPDEWFCDECLSSNEGPTLEGGLKKESPRPPCFKRKKSNGVGKMKFISPEEAIMLSSGAVRPVPPSKVVKPKFSPPKAKASTSFYSSGCLKIPRKGCEQIRPLTNRQQSRILNESEEPNDIVTTVNDYICNEEALNSMCGKETGTYNTNIEKASCRDVHHTVPEFKNPSMEDIAPLNLIAYRYSVYRPAQDVTWKGGFKIDGEFYDGFWGQPPFRVRRKAYEFSKAMCPVLEVKLVRQSPLWTNLFCGGNADFCDIGLYFLPGNLERSKKNLAWIFELMENQDVAMETCIDGVEVLIFTSSKLLMNTEMLMDDDHKRFLWGVFHPVAAKEKPIDCKEKPIDCSSQVEDNDACGEEMDMDMDMEIDMMGGVVVGSVDVCVASTRCCEETTLLQQQVKVEGELGLDVPPGFEEISRQKAMVKDQETFNPPGPREEVTRSVKPEKMDV